MTFSVFFKKAVNRTLRYFFQGLLLAVPIIITGYVLVSIFNWLDNLIPVKNQFTGLGTLIIVGACTFLGFLGSTFLAKRAFQLFDQIINRLPLVKIIYSSLKDLVSAFVGDQKKFDQAVLVKLNQDSDLHKLGFITQTDLSQLGIEEMVAVYLPHSYNFSGDLYIVPSRNVKPLQAQGSDVMKFIVSGGVSGLPEGGSVKQ
jgi:uncharacterized membrane protein